MNPPAGGGIADGGALGICGASGLSQYSTPASGDVTYGRGCICVGVPGRDSLMIKEQRPFK